MFLTDIVYMLHLVNIILSDVHKVYKYPSQAVMERRIREHHSWSIYKETLVNRLKRH